MSVDDDQRADVEVLDMVREETALDLAAFRRFVYRVGDVSDDADLMEASMAAAQRIEAVDGRLQFLEQEIGRQHAAGERGEEE